MIFNTFSEQRHAHNYTEGSLKKKVLESQCQKLVPMKRYMRTKSDKENDTSVTN